MLMLLFGIYYLTIFIHLIGIAKIFADKDISLGLGLIPFYYCFKKKTVKKKSKKKPIKKKPSVNKGSKKTPVKKN